MEAHCDALPFQILLSGATDAKGIKARWPDWQTCKQWFKNKPANKLLCSLCIFGSLEPVYQKILLYSNALALPVKAVALCFISLSPQFSIWDGEKTDKPNNINSACLRLSSTEASTTTHFPYFTGEWGFSLKIEFTFLYPPHILSWSG